MGGKNMTVEGSSKILKIFGILGIIGAILSLIVGAIMLFAGPLVVATGEEGTEEMGVLAFVVGIIMIISGIISLIEGICSVRAAKDNSKIGPAWFFAILGLVMGVISLGTTLANGGSIAGSIPSILFSILIFMAANTIKKDQKNLRTIE